MAKWQEAFLPVQDRLIGMGSKIGALHRAGGQMNPDGFGDGGMGFRQEFRIAQKGNGIIGRREFDDVEGGIETQPLSEFTTNDETGSGSDDSSGAYR